jgi:hypothetical protein
MTTSTKGNQVFEVIGRLPVAVELEQRSNVVDVDRFGFPRFPVTVLTSVVVSDTSKATLSLPVLAIVEVTSGTAAERRVIRPHDPVRATLHGAEEPSLGFEFRRIDLNVFAACRASHGDLRIVGTFAMTCVARDRAKHPWTDESSSSSCHLGSARIARPLFGARHRSGDSGTGVTAIHGGESIDPVPS